MKPSEIAKKRYSTKVYDPSKKISPELIEELKSALHLAPSSINIQPWKFSFVQNPEVKAKLAAASMFNADKINQADLLIVFSAPENIQAFEEMALPEMPEAIVEMYKGAKSQMSEEQLKGWLTRQVYIALGQALSAAPALGLDSTPMEGIEADKYMDILNMQDFKPVVALAVGYASPEDFNRLEASPKQRRDVSKVIESI